MTTDQTLQHLVVINTAWESWGDDDPGSTLLFFEWLDSERPTLPRVKTLVRAAIADYLQTLEGRNQQEFYEVFGLSWGDVADVIPDDVWVRHMLRPVTPSLIIRVNHDEDLTLDDLADEENHESL